MIDLVVVVGLAALGWFLVPTSWGPGERAAAALPLGAAAHVVAHLALFSAGVSAVPSAAVLAALVTAAAVRAAVARPTVGAGGVRVLAAAAVVAGLVTAVTVAIPVVNITADSFRYWTIASILADGAGGEAGGWFLFQSRGFATGSLHGLAGLTPGYVRPLSPLVAISTLSTLAIVTRDELRRGGGRLAAATGVALALAVATSHRVAYTALYLNGHIEFAAWLLLLGVVVWRAVRDPARHATATTAVVAALLAAAIVVVRPEGALVALVALVPAVVATGPSRSWRAIPLVGLGLSSLAWHGAVLAPRIARSPDELGVDVLGLVVLGAGCLLLAAALGLVDRVLDWSPVSRTSPLLLAHAGLWAVTILLGLREPSVVRRAAVATVRNVTSDGLWGSSLWLLAVGLVVALVVLESKHVGALVFPVLAFVPLGLLFALLRGGSGYRLGPGDSMNRMIVHVVPLAALAIGVLAAGSVRDRWTRQTGGDEVTVGNDPTVG